MRGSTLLLTAPLDRRRFWPTEVTLSSPITYALETYVPLSLPRTAGVAAASIAIMLTAGCSNGSAECSLGAESPEAALSNFLVAAQASDLEGMRSQVFPILEVTSADLETVADDLVGAEANNLVLWRNELKPGHYLLRATTVEDVVLGQWEVGEMEEPHLGCYAVSWGEPTSDSPNPTPSSKVSPTL